MSANGISTLPTKAARKQAKLNLAQAKRSTGGTIGYRPLHVLDTSLVAPTVGRPWK
jgi:hypothetical protein